MNPNPTQLKDQGQPQSAITELDLYYKIIGKITQESPRMTQQVLENYQSENSIYSEEYIANLPFIVNWITWIFLTVLLVGEKTSVKSLIEESFVIDSPFVSWLSLPQFPDKNLPNLIQVIRSQINNFLSIFCPHEFLNPNQEVASIWHEIETHLALSLRAYLTSKTLTVLQSSLTDDSEETEYSLLKSLDAQRPDHAKLFPQKLKGVTW